MRRLCLLVLPLLPDAATARCVPFDFFQSLGKIPLLVHARVIQSNKESLVSAPCNRVGCEHKFSADVVEVLKGKTAATRLQFDYRYVRQRPEIALFAPGDDYVFALSRISPSGAA